MNIFMEIGVFVIKILFCCKLGIMYVLWIDLIKTKIIEAIKMHG